MQSYGYGRSSVTGYEEGAEYIIVRFASGVVYEYTYKMPGRQEVEMMIQLAKEGLGLNSYINRYVRKRFARQLA